MNEKYIKKFKEHLARTKNVVGSLSMLNAYTLGIPQNLLIQDAEDIIDFYDWFFENYEDDNNIWKGIYENWGEIGPRIFRLAEDFIEMENEAYFIEVYKNFENNTRKNVDNLVDYIWNLREQRFLTFSYDDEDLDSEFLEIPKTIKKAELNNYKKDLKLLIVKVVDLGGIFILRVCEKDEDSICGFLVSDNKIIKIDKKDLANTYDKNPYELKRVEVYREANIDFI